MPVAIRLEGMTIEDLTGLQPDYRTCSAHSRSELDVSAETLAQLTDAMLPAVAEEGEPATTAA